MRNLNFRFKGEKYDILKVKQLEEPQIRRKHCEETTLLGGIQIRVLEQPGSQACVHRRKQPNLGLRCLSGT